MIKKSAARSEIFERIKAVKDSLGIDTFVDTPDAAISTENIPAVIMQNGGDEPVKRSSRGASFPIDGDVRLAEIRIEIVAPKSSIETIFRGVRSSIFQDIFPVKVDGVPDKQVHMMFGRTEGPVGYGKPGIYAMLFVINLTYVDFK